MAAEVKLHRIVFRLSALVLALLVAASEPKDSGRTGPDVADDITRQQPGDLGNNNLGLQDVVFIIQSQRYSYHAKKAHQLRENIRQQAQDVQQDPPTVVVLHEEWRGRGAWTIFPFLPKISQSFGQKAAWVFFCEDDTAVKLLPLLDVLRKYDATKELFLGRALVDQEATIIHHFAFHEKPGSFSYPDFSAGWALSAPLLNRLAKRWSEESHQGEFTIDPKHEIAMYIYDSGNGVKLTDVPQFCAGPQIEDETSKCVTTFPSELPQCGDPVPQEKVFFAVKTCEKYHKDRVPVVQHTWGKQARHITYYSDKEDSTIPTVTTGVPNTERGHCGKAYAIMKQFHTYENLKKMDWLIIADDDTLLSVPRLLRVLSCYDPSDPIFLGERYGYGLTRGEDSGYAYITGGGGMVLSRAGVRTLMLSSCGCPADDSPDDMILGMCSEMTGVQVVHSQLFHQARPADYSTGYLSHQPPVSFHKHWNNDPYKVYNKYLLTDGEKYNHTEL
ncbi:PREDICTED: beta-1,3-glucosyltransferase-like [Branchiostoma belcheri]|uniref:Beta-1,3-glucosyltransferase-like n=1 Tax=Branchiostoma belcheri TaxID=7741 RepID=A0A6P4ZUZ1_BRABE|nr:PREDICTED: beta-1,3-glucosyltransferase-like [Branchiostoma belcheri]